MREQVSDMITHTAQHMTYAILHCKEIKEGTVTRVAALPEKFYVNHNTRIGSPNYVNTSIPRNH